MTVEIDPDRAAIITRLFTDYATGWFTTRSLADRLNADGVESPRGAGWAGHTVGQIIGNVAYMGKTYSVSRRHRTGDLITAKWPALIEPELWEAV